MSESNLSVWQVLPLVIPDCHGSPYQSCSAFASSPALFSNRGDKPDEEALEKYRLRQSYWIEDFALFRVLSARYPGRPWWQWPDEFARRDPGALEALAGEAREPIRRIIEFQFRFDECWKWLRKEAGDRGIALFGDLPIFVSHESADIWASPQGFLLDDDFQPRYVAGVPPDYFSDTGQRWGNPHYDWDYMASDGFSWWRSRLKRHFDWFDLVRLDHFRGLSAVWMIDADCDTAIEGFWRETPGRELLEILCKEAGELPIVAEDLGIITDDVRELRHEFHLPGMAVLQFAFDGSTDNPHRPSNITEDTVAYTGTHDNDTCVGWFQSRDARERAHVFDVLGEPPADDIAEVMINATLGSRACLAMSPFQDFLRLGSSARMNTPGAMDNNWKWKFEWEQVDDGLSTEIKDWVRSAGRSAHG